MNGDFMLSNNPPSWLGGEPRVFAVTTEECFPKGWRAVENARLIDVTYAGGGIGPLFHQIASAAGIAAGSFQAMLELLEDLSAAKPLVVCIRGGDRLLADIGPALIRILLGWERFARHGRGVSQMYLVVEIGPTAPIHAAFFPGGVVDWFSAARSTSRPD